MRTTVTYKGFLQTVNKTFDTREEAIDWIRKVGQHNNHSVRFTHSFEEAPDREQVVFEYRYLKAGEEILCNDQFRPTKSYPWQPAYPAGQVSERGVGLYRRPV